MNGWWWAIIGPGIWFALIILAARAGAWSARRRDAGDRLAATQQPPARQEVASQPAAPGTRTPHVHKRLGLHVLTVRYYAGGSIAWDGRGRKIAEFSAPLPSDEEFDDWLKGLTQ